MTQQTMSPVDLYENGSRYARNVVAGVKQEQVDDPTPCAEWNVQALISHLIGGAENISRALSGEAPENPPGASDSSHSAETSAQKLAQVYDAAAARVLEAARRPGALERKIPSPIGEMTGGQFLSIMFMDHYVHGWDLARATGQDTTLDPGLVEACYSMSVPDLADQGRSFGVFGPAVAVADSASLQDKLLAYLGRQV